MDLKPISPIAAKAKEVEDHIKSDEPVLDPDYTPSKGSFITRISTGSTLLDLGISGKRHPLGGIPGGVIVEMFGREGTGKTALLMELLASVQAQGGEGEVLDPEARVDFEYSRTYGAKIPEEIYHRPDTVEEAFQYIRDKDYKPSTKPRIVGADSLAALSTALEMDKGDKMGMKRAKEFSAGFRTIARKIANANVSLICTNQVREGDYGVTTPGGMAIRFYASLRIQLRMTGKVEKEMKVFNSKVKKVLGIETECEIVKSTIDDPFRKAPIIIRFGYGVDDLAANLQWIKDIEASKTYNVGGKTYLSRDQAINYVEGNDLEKDIRNKVIAMWNEVEDTFAKATSRKPKERV